MAKRDQDEIRAALAEVRREPLPSYREEDLSPSTVQDVYRLADRMRQDPTLTGKIMKLFSETVEAVPPPDRVKFLYAIIGLLLAMLVAFVVLKIKGVW